MGCVRCARACVCVCVCVVWVEGGWRLRLLLERLQQLHAEGELEEAADADQDACSGGRRRSHGKVLAQQGGRALAQREEGEAVLGFGRRRAPKYSPMGRSAEKTS